MHTYLTILLRLPDNVIVASLFFLNDLPHQLTPGDTLVIDGGGLREKVKTVEYDLANNQWRVELSDYTVTDMEDASGAVLDLMQAGWKHRGNAWQATADHLAAARPAPPVATT